MCQADREGVEKVRLREEEEGKENYPWTQRTGTHVFGQHNDTSFGNDENVPSLSPLDKLRLDLDAAWEHGCTLSKDKRSGRALSPGMGRIMRAQGRWSDGFCHVDELDLISQTRGLFGANVYLRVPRAEGTAGDEALKAAAAVDEVEVEAAKAATTTTRKTRDERVGGGVEIFPLSVSSRWDFYRNAYTLSNLLSQDEEGQRRLRAALPDPIYVEPEAGDLLILCSQRPHAVVGFDAGERVSVQTFLTHARGKAIHMDC